MRREDNRNIKVRATSELNIFPNEKGKKKSEKEKRWISMYVIKPKKDSSDEIKLSSLKSQHSTYSCTAKRNSTRSKDITQIKVRSWNSILLYISFR